MMKVGVISDTHGLLRQEVLEILRDCDCILHAGDINNQVILEELSRIAPVYVVRGNNDKEWAEHLPHDLTAQLEQVEQQRRAAVAGLDDWVAVFAENDSPYHR